MRLDARTKLLNPKFYEGMLNSGYEGAREITKRLKNTMGWSATSGEVDNFIYEDANDVFIKVSEKIIPPQTHKQFFDDCTPTSDVDFLPSVKIDVA